MIDLNETECGCEETGCMWCGEVGDEFHGLDLCYSDDGRQTLDWIPCCETVREAVGMYGWAEVYGRPLEADVADLFGLELRELCEDGTPIFPLEVAPVPEGVPGAQTEVFAIVEEHHRHHEAPQGWKFGIKVYNGRALVGVAVVGRPVSRMLAKAEPLTLEVTRVCTFGDSRLRRNASSALYGCACREAAARGFSKVITYTLESENGASLKASNFAEVSKTRGGSWNRPSRGRADKAPTCTKTRWERVTLTPRDLERRAREQRKAAGILADWGCAQAA